MKVRSLTVHKMALAIVAALAPLSASVVSAAVINIDMDGTVYSGVGVAPDTGTVWNAAGSGTTGFLKDSTGVTTGVKFTNDLPSIYGSSRPNNLMNGYRYTSSEVGHFSFNGLEANTAYDLYLYSAPNNTNSLFTVGAQTLTLSGTDATSTGFVASDWGMLTVTSDGSGTIAGTVFKAGTGLYTAFNGVQIASVPEPAALGLLTMAGLMALRRRR